jgi:hypothetical protein
MTEAARRAAPQTAASSRRIPEHPQRRTRPGAAWALRPPNPADPRADLPHPLSPTDYRCMGGNRCVPDNPRGTVNAASGSRTSHGRPGTGNRNHDTLDSLGRVGVGRAGCREAGPPAGLPDALRPGVLEVTARGWLPADPARRFRGAVPGAARFRAGRRRRDRRSLRGLLVSRRGPPLARRWTTVQVGRGRRPSRIESTFFRPREGPRPRGPRPS